MFMSYYTVALVHIRVYNIGAYYQKESFRTKSQTYFSKYLSTKLISLLQFHA